MKKLILVIAVIASFSGLKALSYISGGLGQAISNSNISAIHPDVIKSMTGYSGILKNMTGQNVNLLDEFTK